MERFHQTSQAVQDSKITLNRATNLLRGLHDFIQFLRPQFQKFERRGQILSSCHHYTEEISRKKRRKVRLDSVIYIYDKHYIYNLYLSKALVN